MSKVLALTGVTGKKSGSILFEKIAGNIESVRSRFPGGIRVLARPSSHTEQLEAALPEVQICRGELSDAAFLREALQGVDTVLHIAGIQLSREIVDAAAACGVRRLILIHTTGIYSKYKAAGEEYRKIDAYVLDACTKNRILLTVCRPTMIYGNVYDMNVVKFIQMVDRLPVMPVVNGARYELQPVHYADLGEAYYRVLMQEEETVGKDFILSGGKPILLREMLTVIGKELGKDVHFISCPFGIAYAGAWGLYLLTLGKKDYREKVQRLCEPRTFAHEEAERAFGFAPRTFEEGIPGEVEEYREKRR